MGVFARDSTGQRRASTSSTMTASSAGRDSLTNSTRQSSGSSSNPFRSSGASGDTPGVSSRGTPDSSTLNSRLNSGDSTAVSRSSRNGLALQQQQREMQQQQLAGVSGGTISTGKFGAWDLGYGVGSPKMSGDKSQERVEEKFPKENFRV